MNANIFFSRILSLKEHPGIEATQIILGAGAGAGVGSSCIGFLYKLTNATQNMNHCYTQLEQFYVTFRRIQNWIRLSNFQGYILK